MGRSNESKEKRKAKRKRQKEKLKDRINHQESKSSDGTAAIYTVDQLLDKVQEYMDTFDFDLAQKFCQRALDIDPINVKALEMSGILLLELGNIDAAKQCLGRAVEIAPNEGHTKYMYLGQLLNGKEAVDCFRKGIELMTKMLSEQVAESSSVHTVTNHDVSKAYCSIAELYMTDLCFEESAEELCKTNIQYAIDNDPQNPEAFQLMASYLLVRENIQEAKNMIQQSISIWLPKLENIEKEGNGDEFDPVEPCPISFQQRIKAAQILIEVEEYETCIKVLDTLTEEDEEVVEVWYLLGWVNYLQGDDYKGNARFFLNKAKEVFKKVGCDDEPMLKHIVELLDGLGPDLENDENDVDHNIDEEASSSDEDAPMEQ